MKKEDYEKWVNKAYQFIVEVHPQICQREKVNVGSTQYIPTIDGDIEFVFLGHDAHEGRGEGDLLDITNAKERFYKGNGNPRQWRLDKRWKIWNNIESAFKKVGFNEIMHNGYISEEILEKTIVTNALLFNYPNKAKELNATLEPCIVNQCMELAGELIFDVIKPKLAICLSCPLVFEPLIRNYYKNNNAELHEYEVFHLEGTRKKVMRCVCNGVTVLGIPHTSYYVPNSVAAFVREAYLGKDISYKMVNRISVK